jgi:hypothetical protein
MMGRPVVKAEKVLLWTSSGMVLSVVANLFMPLVSIDAEWVV